MTGRSVLAFLLVWLLAATASAQSLRIADRQTEKSVSAAALLADPATRTVTIDDPVYRRSMTYRAIPVNALLKGLAVAADDYVRRYINLAADERPVKIVRTIDEARAWLKTQPT